jgi:hypothetical protein
MERALKPGGFARVDDQIGRESGYDPDLRFIEGYANVEDVREKLRYEELGFELHSDNLWSLEPGRNTFQRPIAFHFMDLWLRKIERKT